MIKFLSFLLIILFTYSLSYSHDPKDHHAAEEWIRGSGIEIKITNGEELRGTVNSCTAEGSKQCGNLITLTLTDPQGGTRTYEVKNLNGKLMGHLLEGDETHKVEFVAVDIDKQTITLKTAEGDVLINFTYARKADPRHFQDILFEFVKNSNTYEIELKGNACIGSTVYCCILFYMLAGA